MALKLSGWYKWSVFDYKEKGFLIRRYRKVNGKIKWQTHPRATYKDLPKSEVEALVRRLNTSHIQKENESKKKYDFDHAYINQKVLSDFLTKLETEASDRNHINSLFNALNTYTLKYFVADLELPDPNGWKKAEAKFGKFLLGQKIGPRRIKGIIQLTNRFIKFLHDQYPDEVRLFHLEPVSKNVLKHLKATTPNTERLKYISEKDFKTICEKIEPSLLPAIKISYLFGLRCGEVLGLQLDDVYEDALNVERQLNKLEPIAHYSPLKNKEKRNVPYWVCTPDEIYSIIQSLDRVHPDTLSRAFRAEMARLKMPYQFHDLRRTWITNSLRKHHYRDVQLAAGHADLKTTQGYAQDDRELQRKKFKPKIALAK